jgi:CYTH domain-containing protein
MAHALSNFFDSPVEAAPARRSIGRRVLDALHDFQMSRVRRELRFHGHLFETDLVQGDLRRIGLSQSDILPFGK